MAVLHEFPRLTNRREELSQRKYVAMVLSLMKILQSIDLPAKIWMTGIEQVLKPHRQYNQYGSCNWKTAASTLLYQENLNTEDPWHDVGAWLLSENGRHPGWGSAKLNIIIKGKYYRLMGHWDDILDRFRVISSALSDEISMVASTSQLLPSSGRDTASSFMSMESVGREQSHEHLAWAGDQQSRSARSSTLDLEVASVHEESVQATPEREALHIPTDEGSERAFPPMEIDETASHQRLITTGDEGLSALESSSDEMMDIDS